MKLKCLVCGIEVFVLKQKHSILIQHCTGYANNKRKYFYHKMTYPEYERLLSLGKTSKISKYSQVNGCTENLNLRLVNENRPEDVRAGSLAWLGHLLDVQKVAGSSPVRPTKHQ